ncbi:hypothetical protein [Halomonas stenophila]|uniref:Uncharacterized protein n=1 Tax=Halomonas stenophila TaxID=795312 RepID=A0A7W5HLM9_9GAMM|nr:hypothetical protein [Halomonas stenophila]MBB3231731.1 hypothetical protein [Halomonas stenophila]
MTSVNPALRLIEATEIGEASVSQMLRDLGAEQREQIAVAIVSSHQFQPRAAFVCLHGPHTQRYLDAIEQVRRDIKLDQRYGGAK